MKKADRVLPNRFLRELKIIFANHGKHAANGKDKQVGYMTLQKREQDIMHGFAELHELGYKIELPVNFRGKHMQALVDHWVANGKSPATIQNKISMFRIFAGWIGKDGMIRDSADYVPTPDLVHRQYIAVHDKSWEGNGVTPAEVIAKVAEENQMAGLYLELCNEFGMRRKEAICFRPFVDVDGMCKNIYIRSGTKGGRMRVVPIETDSQRATLDKAKEMADKRSGKLMNEGRTLQQNITYIANLMTNLGITKKKMGATIHGLRAGYAMRRYKTFSGVDSPVRGGQPGDVDRQTDKIARLQTSEELGHARVSVTTAYYGSHGHAIRKAPATTPGEKEKG